MSELTFQLPPPPSRWGARMTVMHRITGEKGLVQSVDFDEQVVLVKVGDADAVAAWRIENVFEVSGA